jgi:uncharacterized membrane protein
VVQPLTGWLPLVRVAPVLLFALAVIALIARPWRWSTGEWDAVGRWNPAPGTVRVAAVLVGLIVFWFVLTKFQSGDINAIDFTVYYERPNYQTLHGRPLYVESADDPLRAYRSLFAVHSHWIMLPLALFYAVRPSPFWVLALSIVSVVAGALYTLRIGQRIGAGGAIASASALAFVFNANTARALNFGFHVEVLYAWFIPWMLYEGVMRRWGRFLFAALLVVSVKEDAILVLIAAVVSLLLFHRRERPGRQSMALFVPLVLALVNLAFFYRVVVPRLSATKTPFYANYWSNYGPTMVAAMVGMLRRPFDVLAATLTSGFLTHVITPHAYLPFVGWPWFVGAVPIVLLYGASANEQLRAFGIYYAIPLVPFLTISAADGARRLADRLGSGGGRARALAAAMILVAALLAGASNAGYSLRPWKAQVAAVPRMLRDLSAERLVLVQSALYPHAGYEERVQLLTLDSLRDPRYAGAALLLAPGLSAYPLSDAELSGLTRLRVVAESPEGLLVVRAQP